MKKLVKKAIIPLTLLILVLVLGLFIGFNSWDKNLYVQWSPSKGRGVAGKKSSEQLLNLSYDQLSQQARTAVFSKNEVIEENGYIAFYLGNFLVPDSQRQRHQFICQIFPFVEFSFSSIGVILSGERGLMVIQSPCNMEDENFIGPFWIPQKDILAHPSKESYTLPEKETFIRFYHASIELIPRWLLTHIRFFHKDQKQKEFIIHFIPGEDAPYFELSLKSPSESLSQETTF